MQNIEILMNIERLAERDACYSEHALFWKDVKNKRYLIYQYSVALQLNIKSQAYRYIKI